MLQRKHLIGLIQYMQFIVLYTLLNMPILMEWSITRLRAYISMVLIQWLSASS